MMGVFISLFWKEVIRILDSGAGGRQSMLGEVVRKASHELSGRLNRIFPVK
tara:strand:+ start:705 stop:857 length:153 start_codon:yes stop_codon:yes gene_type:complete